MKRFASMFTGGGLADQGARMAGLTPVWGVEFDPAIAAVAQQNDDSGTVYAADVRSVDYAALPRVDVLHASPPCPNFSVAKTDRGETALDLALADAVVRAITAQRPRLFTLENVRGYAGSESLTRIQAALLDLDYHVTTVVLNAADYGVAQTRERLFLIAHAGGWMQPARPLPAPVPWKGWYQAIEDLIPTLPESAFAPWQLARLPGLAETALIRGDNSQQEITPERQYRRTWEPSPTIRAAGGARAFIAEGQPGLNGTHLNVRDGSDPIWTIPASADRKPARAWLSTGRVVSMTPRALGRFQSLPDTYRLPDKKALACKIIGNGVACRAYAALLRSQL